MLLLVDPIIATPFGYAAKGIIVPKIIITTISAMATKSTPSIGTPKGRTKTPSITLPKSIPRPTISIVPYFFTKLTGAIL